VCGESTDYSFLAARATEETAREACIGNIKAFVRGGREGLDRLRKVLPNILRTFPDLPAADMLVECGLEPVEGGGQFPTFYFQPMLDGAAMVQAARISRKRQRDDVRYRSQELLEAYDALRSEWSP
jgi:hypothetical protein